jgi:transcriptional regulator with XRE-family HTH domain
LISKIYEFRKRKRWTLKKLSQLSGIPLNTVWRMEKGYGVTLNNAFAISAIFEVSVYELWNIGPSAIPVVPPSGRVTSIRNLRLKRHWALDDLAKASGVSKSTLSVTESGHTPTLENAAKISAALGVSIYQIWKPSSLRPE